MRVSVVMPTYNRAPTLARAIDSVLAQHARADGLAFELIVVDDGSTDDTPAVLERYAAEPAVVTLRTANRGGNHARNRGIERARGGVICFLDSDDEFLPGKIGFVDRFFTQHPEVDALVDSFEVRRAPPKRPVQRRTPVLTDSAALREAVFARRLYKATPAISARRQALVDVGMFDESLRRRQDMDLILRLTRAYRCATTDAVLWVKHESGDSISSARETFLQAAIDICRRHPDYLSEPAYRRGLDADLGRYFWRLLKAGRIGALRRELRRYRGYPGFDNSPWLLVLRHVARPRKRLVAPR